AKPLARLLADFCGDLSNIGRHNEAVTIAERMAARPTGDELHTYRLSNLAAWLLQRATSHRIAEQLSAATADPDTATTTIAAALAGWHELEESLKSDQAYHLREATAIQLSILSEQAAEPPEILLTRFRDLLRAADSAHSWEDTYLQSAFRIG